LIENCQNRQTLHLRGVMITAKLCQLHSHRTRHDIKSNSHCRIYL